MKFFHSTLLLIALAFTSHAQSAIEEEADVIVYGATPGGFCAAIAAAREGSKVLLMEPTDHVGGVNTGGLCFSDSNQTVRSALRGLFEEWHQRIEDDYQQRGVTLTYTVKEKNQKSWTYEPHVAAKITKQMLEEAKVRVLTGQVLQSVKKEGARIAELITTKATFKAQVFIDATYEGDLMAAAGVSFTIGREGRKDFNEPLAGKHYSKPVMPISGYDDQGKLLPLITTADGGAEEDGDKNVMIYSFRLCLTKDAANRVPFPAPMSYDPARFEVVRRYFAQTKNVPLLWDLYPLPNGKFDANNGIGKQFSMGLIGACNGWCEADPAGRARIWEAHRQYTLELYHFLTTDPAVPETLRNQLGELGLCQDEFAATDHWSPQLYVREGRRMRGMHVLTQHDVLEDFAKPDSIMVSSFPIDSHDCQRIARKDGTVVNEGTIFPARLAGRGHAAPYQVPYRSLLPIASECENLLVPVALSATHVAYSSIRVEPTWMALGQSAGVAAALAAKTHATVQTLPYEALRARLLAQGQVLDIPVLPELPKGTPAVVEIDPAKLPGIVLDDSQAELQGKWDRSSSFKPHVGQGYVHDGKRADGQSSAAFKFTVPRTGRYDLRIAYSAHPTRASKIPVTLQTGNRKTMISFDETQPLPPGEAFRSAGEFEFMAGTETTITFSNAGTDGFVIVDAIQLLEVMK